MFLQSVDHTKRGAAASIFDTQTSKQSNTYPMKKIFKQTVHSIHPVFTPKGWNYLVIPSSVIECMQLKGKCTGISNDKKISTIYLS